MKLNTPKPHLHTHEGAVAQHIQPEQQLRRSVMACMLWEREFYEDGAKIAGRIAELIPKVKPDAVAAMAVEARSKMKLRHAPLLLVREMARHATHRGLVRKTLAEVIQRPDELTEFLAIYWKDGREKLAKSAQRGLADAFRKFNEYELAKYDRDGAVKLRDVLFLSHAKPKDAEQAELWRRLAERKLVTPNTWEVALSAGADKRETFERLIAEQKLGALALLRNLRNMEQAGVPRTIVKAALSTIKAERVLPFRFIAAARYAPWAEPELEAAMYRCVEGQERLAGHSTLLLDVSGSMDAAISSKSEMTRMDAACGLAVLAREMCESVDVYTFSNACVEIPARRGFALRDAIVRSQPHSNTCLGAAVQAIGPRVKDRLIVFTDEQSRDAVPALLGAHTYMVNVASAKNGVGYGAWKHIDGFSEATLTYIKESEVEAK